MTQYARSQNTQFVAVQSADPIDLQNKVMEALAAIGALPVQPQTFYGVVGMNLAGAGDGYTFIVTIAYALLPADVMGLFLGISSPPSTVVRCYLAGDAEELVVARAATQVPPPVSGVSFVLADEQAAGASKGTRFMGMSVYAIASTPNGAASPVALATKTTPNQAINASTPTLILFQALEALTSFFALADTNSTLQYLGFQSVLATAEASVTVVATADATAVTVEIIRDPLGTPLVEGSMTASLLTTGDSINIGVQAIIGLLPLAGSNKYAVRITTDKATVVQDASLLVSPVAA